VRLLGNFEAIIKQSARRIETERLIREASDLEDEGKIDAAVKRYTMAARLGDPIAQSNLGTLLDDVVVPRRPGAAVYWYKRAVKLGHDGAAWNMAMHYRNLGKRRWYLHWLRVAAEMGDPDAQRALRKVKN